VVIRAKGLLSGRKGPLVLNYRVMGTFAPADHWVYDPVKGGGRIIGEACHFFDLLCHIVDSEPVSLTAIGGTLSHPGTHLDDNLICTLAFADGSIASLVYGDLGTAQYPKEFLEMFAGEGVLAIDDFRELKVNGFSGQKGMLLAQSDKGHKAELKAITDALLNGVPSPIDAKAGLRAMKCSFAAMAALRSGEIQYIKNEEIG
jgi:predicted dehydrogenase